MVEDRFSKSSSPRSSHCDTYSQILQGTWLPACTGRLSSLQFFVLKCILLSAAFLCLQTSPRGHPSKLGEVVDPGKHPGVQFAKEPTPRLRTPVFNRGTVAPGCFYEEADFNLLRQFKTVGSPRAGSSLQSRWYSVARGFIHTRPQPGRGEEQQQGEAAAVARLAGT